MDIGQSFSLRSTGLNRGNLLDHKFNMATMFATFCNHVLHCFTTLLILLALEKMLNSGVDPNPARSLSGSAS